ncbi:MAG: hypothetical protein U1F57_04055 [bacterium]
MNQDLQENLIENTFHFIDFSKASPEAINVILNALNQEVDEAMTQKRFPTLDGAFKRLTHSSSMLM